VPRGHTDLVQCAVRRPFPLLAWAAVPWLFTAAVLGLTSLGEFLLGLPADTMVTSAHLGAATGVTVVVGFSIEWPSTRWRELRWVYVLVVFVVGIVVHGTVMPPGITLVAGLPSAVILARITWLHRYPKQKPRSDLVSGF
jgi:hypothetical protein